MCLKSQIFTNDEIVGVHDSWKFLLAYFSSFLLVDQYIDKEILNLCFNARYQIVDNFKSKMIEEKENIINIKFLGESFPQLSMVTTHAKFRSLWQWSLP